MYQDPYQSGQNPGQPPYSQPGGGQGNTYYGSPSPSGSPNPYGTTPSDPYGAPSPYGQPGTQPSYGVPPYAQPPTTKKSGRLWIVLSIIGGLLIISCTACMIVAMLTGSKGGSSNNGQATPTPNQTATAQQDLYTQATSGKAVIDDPLDGSSTSLWTEEHSDKTTASCKYTGGEYHINEPSPDYFFYCYEESTNFSDFAFQVQMTMVSGREGGLLFRSDAQHENHYYLTLSPTGRYHLYKYQKNTDPSTIGQGDTQAFTSGLNQSNLITIIARGGEIYLYINKTYVDHFSDDAFTSGSIGLAAGISSEASFKHVQVWKL